jgi:hypothetical protein
MDAKRVVFIERPSEIPTLDQIYSYLESKGWQREFVELGWMVYRLENYAALRVSVPLSYTAGDWVRCFKFLLQELAVIEKRYAYQVLDDILSQKREE